jgi:Putative transposase
VVYLKLPFGGAESPTIAWSPLPMAKSLFACVILLTTTNRSCCPHSLNKFLCRFLLHILPQGFLRIRNFGFLVDRKRATLLPLAFNCWVRHNSRKPNNTPLPLKMVPIFGAALNVVDPSIRLAAAAQTCKRIRLLFPRSYTRRAEARLRSYVVD